MAIEFVSADITTIPVDAIVVPCSPHPIVTETLNGSVYRTAGNALLAARKEVGALPFGRGAILPAFQLPAKHVIHVATPMWQGGLYGEADTLRRCYETICYLAASHHITSLALPLLGYGVQEFPYDIARDIFIEMLVCSKDMHDVHISLVHTNHSLLLQVKESQDIRDYVSCLFKPTANASDPAPISATPYHIRETNSHDLYQTTSLVEKDLAARLSLRDKTFSDTLLSFIADRGLKESVVYKKANIDRKLFSKIKTNPNYQPTKATALAFAIALELTLVETNELLRTAGYTLTYSNKSDIIVEYFILKNEYDIFTINEALFAFGEQSLGSH